MASLNSSIAGLSSGSGLSSLGGSSAIGGLNGQLSALGGGMASGGAPSGLTSLSSGAVPGMGATGASDASGMGGLGISGSTLQLMSQISTMMASVMTGLMAFMQQLMASNAQRQQQASLGQTPGGSPGASPSPTPGASPGSAPAPGASPSPSSSSGKGGVDAWVDEAYNILIQNGTDPSKISKEDIKTIIEHESSGNPNATNNWDSNAAAGNASVGLMQTIPPTFNAHALAGHKNIKDPVDNIIAGVRYAVSRYGSTANVPGVKSIRNGGGYKPY